MQCDEVRPTCGYCHKREIRCSLQEQAFDDQPVTFLPRAEELGLVHFYTIHTAPTICRGHDLNIWQVTLPEQAFQHNFLLDCLLALTCLHQGAIGNTLSGHSPWQWGKFAISYQTRALENFRPILSKITSANCHAAFGFSILTKVTALSLLNNTLRDPCESIMELREYIRGIGLINQQAEDALINGPFRGMFVDAHGQDLSAFWMTDSPLNQERYDIQSS